MSVLKFALIPCCVLAALILGVIFFFQDPILAHYIWFITLICGGIPIIYGTFRGMLRGEFASDIVAMLAIITAVILNEAFAGAVVVLMQSGGEAIERYGFRKASFSLQELFKRAPRIARRKENVNLEIPVEDVRVGDLLIVRPGEMVPVDGIVVSGSSLVNESALTGEPLEREKRQGASLLSGSVNVSGVIEMRAEALSEESQYAKIVKLVKKAQEEKAPIQRLADRYAVFFTPLTLLMSAIGFLITHDFVTVLAVLVVATPCPLILATPLAVICGINQAAKLGIIVKGGASIEQIANPEAILFDKTGTITFGMPEVEEVVAFGKTDKKELLYAAAAIEQFSTHSIAKAIVQEGLKQFKTLPLPTNFSEVPGQGVFGDLDGHRYEVGSSLLLGEKTDASLQSFLDQGCSLIFVTRDQVPLGVLVLKDHIRPNAASTVKQLYALGVQKIMMITGDRAPSAKVIANQAGIASFAAELFPEKKVEIVKEFKKNFHNLVMVGDGINDAPALATATVGVAMGAHGTAVSAEAADIVLLVDDLSKVIEAVKVGKRMLYIAKQSIFVGIGLSFVLMVVACFGWIAPPIGAGLQEIIDVAVILNALRVLKS